MRTALLAALLLASPAAAGLDPPAWTEPTAPFRIVGDIYYVGSKGLAAYLIASPQGHVLLDGTMDENVAGIEANIVALGFRLRDVKLLLNSHAHFDHAAGLARLKRKTGAAMVASAADRAALESGTPPSITNYGIVKFPAVAVDRLLEDDRPERVGAITMTPLVTPGHTPGCTTWTTVVRERRQSLRVVFPCSLTVAGNRLVGNTGYPSIVADFRATFTRMASLKADVVLPGHPEGADVFARHQRRQAGDADAFVAPRLLATITADARKAFEVELARQSAQGQYIPSSDLEK